MWKLSVAEAGVEPADLWLMKPSSRPCSISALRMAAAARLELAQARLQDECSLYPIELRRKNVLVELRGIEPLHPACRAGIIPLDHSPMFEYWSRRRDLNPHALVYETNALACLELLRKEKFGRPGRTRTCDILFRRQTLWFH
jgi:hypothetical protein